MNRLVDKGDALRCAIDLARELSAFPQACLRADRAASYEQWGLPIDDALRVEFEHGARVLRSGESAAGAARFASGVGRHGESSSPPAPPA